MTTAPPPTGCAAVSEVLSRIGDRWTVQIVVALRGQPLRFNEIKRQVEGISQQMLARVLKALERDGLVLREVKPTAPPQVSYALTALGESLSETVKKLGDWAAANMASIHHSRVRYDDTGSA